MNTMFFKNPKKNIIKFTSLILTLIASLCVTSCKEDPIKEYKGVTLLREIKTFEKTNYSSNKEYLSFVDKLNTFSSKFTKECFDEFNTGDNNLTFSPLSFYMALSLVNECSNGSAKEEILNALNMEENEVKKMTKLLYENSNNDFYYENTLLGREYLTNSIWMDKSLTKKDNCLDSLAENYYCYPYEADFKEHNEETNEAVRDFVKDKTKGLIDKDFNFDDSIILLLMNTLYWKDVWNEDGQNLNKYDNKVKFLENNNKINEVEMYETSYFNGKKLDEKTFTSFKANTYHGYSLRFIIPKDGYSVNDVFTKENIELINKKDIYQTKDEDLKVKYHTRCIFPEFNCDGEFDLENVLLNLGISKIFYDDTSLSNLTDISTIISRVIQVAKLKINKQGGEGAAVTIFAGKATSAGPDVEYKNVYEDYFVDRAFGYVLSDKDGVPLFSGVVNKL